MRLTDSEKADLVQAASGDADEQTRARAGSILKARPQAQAFFAQARAQCDQLVSAFAGAAAAIPLEPLGPGQAAQLAAQIARRADALQRRVLWRRRIAIAAAVALLVAPIAAWKLWPSRTIGHGVFIHAGFTANDAMNQVASFSIKPGTTLTTGNQIGSVRLGRNLVGISPDSEITFDRRITLTVGHMYVGGADPVEVLTNGVTFSVKGEALISRLPTGGITCWVFAGFVHATTSGGAEQIPSGRQFTLAPNGERAVIDAQAQVPAWVSLALKASQMPPHPSRP